MNETSLLQKLILHWSQSGMRLFRNNLGVLRDARGAYVRYGVCNPGGSDLIGWTPVLVSQEMVGRTVAVFTAIEAKREGRDTTAKDRKAKQQAFRDAVLKDGGIATVARNDGDVADALARFMAPRFDPE